MPSCGKKATHTCYGCLNLHALLVVCCELKSPLVPAQTPDKYKIGISRNQLELVFQGVSEPRHLETNGSVQRGTNEIGVDTPGARNVADCLSRE